MQEKNKEYNEREQQIAENRSRNTLFERRENLQKHLMQVSVGSMMLLGMVRQTEYSPFFRSHRMELLESCPEMNCETVKICLSQELRCLPELRLKVAYLKKLLMH